MQPSSRRLFAGVLTFGLAYVLTALVAFPWQSHLLPASPEAPYWIAAGWILLATHGAEMVVFQPGTISHTNPVSDAGFQWLLVVPILVSFIAGVVTVRTSSLSSPVSTAIGGYLTVGYLSATTLSFFVFRVSVTTDTGTTVTGHPDVLSILWLLPAVFVPLVFGSLGAWSGKSPMLDTVFGSDTTGVQERG